MDEHKENHSKVSDTLSFNEEVAFKEPEPVLVEYPEDEDRFFSYDGDGSELLRLYLKNILFTVLTLGVYKFWAETAVKKYHFQHTAFKGSRFDFHATGLERLIGFCKGLILLLPLGGLGYGIFTVVGRTSYFAAAPVIAIYSCLLILGLLRPLLICGAEAFHLARTTWSSVPFRFTGSVKALYKLYIRDIGLMIITLGLYGAWHYVNLERFKHQNSKIGTDGFDYDGKGGDILGLSIAGYFMTYLTAGLLAPLWITWWYNYRINHTTFQGIRLRSNLKAWPLFKVLVSSLFITLFTLGIGLPWCVARVKKLMTDAVDYRGALDLSRVHGEYDSEANALAEGLGEAGEALEAIGQILGG